MIVTSITDTPLATAAWTGQSSGAVFNPTAVPGHRHLDLFHPRLRHPLARNLRLAFERPDLERAFRAVLPDDRHRLHRPGQPVLPRRDP